MALAESQSNALLSDSAENDRPIDRTLEDGKDSAESVRHLGFHENAGGANNESNGSEDSLRRIIDTIPALAWCARPDGSMEFLNKQWHDYTGLSPAETVDWGYRAAFHPEDRKNGSDRCRKLFSGNGPAESEIRLRRYDGVYRWFLIRVEPLRDETARLSDGTEQAQTLKPSSKPKSD